jgi:anti-sigma regulatory factor (Ser/Thr protein kinase)
MNPQPQIFSEDKPLSITIILPTQAYFVSGIRDFTLTLVKNMTGFSEQWAFRFQSIVDELCNNAIEHGSRTGENIKIIFSSEKGQRISVAVEDSGTGPHPKKAEELSKVVEERKKLDPLKMGTIRGRGLSHMVVNWTDELNFIDLPAGGLRVEAIKNLHQAENAKLSAPKIVLTAAMPIAA